MKGKVARRNF